MTWTKRAGDMTLEDARDALAAALTGWVFVLGKDAGQPLLMGSKYVGDPKPNFFKSTAKRVYWDLSADGYWSICKQQANKSPTKLKVWDEQSGHAETLEQAVGLLVNQARAHASTLEAQQ